MPPKSTPVSTVSTPGTLIDCLEGRRMHEWHESRFADWQAWATRHGPNLVFDSRAVVAAATPAAPPHESGVYFLVWSDALCYVGRARSIAERLDAHRAEGRPFECAAWILAPVFASAWIEHAYVEAWHPPWNHARTDGNCCPAWEASRRAIARADGSAVAEYFPPTLPAGTDALKNWELHVIGYAQEMRRRAGVAS